VIPVAKKALFGLALAALACSFAAPDTVVALLARAIATGAAIAAIGLGIREYRPARDLRSHIHHPDPWALLGLGLAFRQLADVFRHVGGEDATGIVGLGQSVVGLAMVVITTYALIEMLRQRFGDRAGDHCFEGIISAGTASMCLWVMVFEPVLHANNIAATEGLPAAIAVTVALVIASLSLHLVISFEHRQPAFVSLAAGEVILVSAALLSFVGHATANNLLELVANALPVLAIAFIGNGALEESMALYEEPSGPAGARLGRLRLAGLIIPVLLGPIGLTLTLTGVLVLSPLAIMTYAIALSLLVVGHLIAMVQARASSTHWASHDKLTGLPNRALFRERTAQALERARKNNTSVAVLYLDLDRFKNINDSMGHEVGDQLLEQVAKRILSCVDHGDTVARLGGDEFAVLLPSIDDDQVPRKLARRMLKTFSSPFNLRPRPVFMSPSVGISVSEGGVSLETLLTQADTAMYRAKESGRNNFAVWSQEMNEASRQRLILETHLHSAIANNELRLVYQPKVELATGNIVGVEALIRWHHPKLGVISPTVFIHLAEESGLINQIGEWVLTTACQQARAWYDQGFTMVTMAVNLSSRQFQHQRVADLVSAALRATRLPPHLLELELTESVAMSGDEATMSNLTELRAMGVRTSIDDFGTGYSNLSYLSRFPLDNLKIDKSFIEQIDKSGGDAAIVVAIIAMAHGLGLNVIAEGVETPEQAGFLARHQCDEMQGFLFSKPLPPQELEGLLMLERSQARNRPTTQQPRRIERSAPDRERIAPPVAAPVAAPRVPPQ
jgi:diguanylate cyclase (GGDEF)-like protein